ncbi:MAG: alpha/beta fold hydrolase [Euzebya sp.]
MGFTADPQIGDVIDVDHSDGSHAAPVVLLHGWTGSKEDFSRIAEAVAAHRRVVVPDLPGHGTCPANSDDDYGLAAHVRWVLDLLAALGIEDLHLVGHSHGGLIAQRVAYLAAHRLRSMTLIGTGVGALGEESSQHVIRVATTARDRGMEQAWSQLNEATQDDVAPDARSAFVRRRFLAMTPQAVLGVARNLVTAMPLGAFLYGIDFPVLVCHGEGDTTWLPHEQRLLARRIPGARYEVIPDALHCPAQENPQAMLGLLVPFLAGADH